MNNSTLIKQFVFFRCRWGILGSRDRCLRREELYQYGIFNLVLKKKNKKQKNKERQEQTVHVKQRGRMHSSQQSINMATAPIPAPTYGRLLQDLTSFVCNCVAMSLLLCMWIMFSSTIIPLSSISCPQAHWFTSQPPNEPFLRYIIEVMHYWGVCIVLFTCYVENNYAVTFPSS